MTEGIKAVPGNATIEKLYAIYYLKEGQKFQQAGNIEKAEENYKHATDVTSKKWKTDALYSLGVLFYNNGADVLRKATPLASSNKENMLLKKQRRMRLSRKLLTIWERQLLYHPIELKSNRCKIR